jgi:predicted glycosyltransferase
LRSGATERFLFYSHDSFGLGHLRRTLALASAVGELAPGANSLIATGSTLASSYRLPPRVETVKLPALTKDDTGHYHAARLGLDVDHVLELRSALLRATAEVLEPTVVVVDKTPLGLRNELLPTLEWLTRRGGCRLVLGLRDIEDSRASVRRAWMGNRLRERICHYYDRVLVYGPSGTMDALDCLGWDHLGMPIDHVGYVGPRIPGRPPSDLRPGYLLITVGGGGDGFRILRTFIESVRLEPLPCDSLVVTGPLMCDDEVRQIADLAAGLQVRVEEFRADMEHVITGARAVVAMAGYNTVAELMAARKPALLVPRVEPRQEQLMRARKLKAEGYVELLHPDRLEPRTMRAALASLLARHPPTPEPDSQDGAGRAAEILVSMAHSGATERVPEPFG